MADWLKIKTEYITTDTSYRKLAKKYGLSHVQVGNVGKEEGWVELKQQYLDETLAQTVDAARNREADRAARIQTVADKLLDKIEDMVDYMESELTSNALRTLAAAVKDLKEIQCVKSALDRREQEARIANLERQAQKDEAADDVPALIVEGLPEEFKA